MSMKFLSAIDLGQNELQNFRVQNLATDPGSPRPGQAWFNSTTFELKIYDGNAVRTIGTLANKLTDFAAASSPLSLARPDHPEPGGSRQRQRCRHQAVCGLRPGLSVLPEARNPRARAAERRNPLNSRQLQENL